MDDEPVQPGRRKWLPVTVLAAGTILIAAPLVYLWRVGKPNRISLRAAPAAPPRRVGALSSASSTQFTLPTPEFPLENASVTAPPPPKAVENGADWDDADWGVPPTPPDPNDNFNGALYTFKAFGAATLIVGSLAFGGVWGLRRYFDTDNAEDFGVKMRLAIMNRMPLLALRMRNALGSPESAPELRPIPGDTPPWNWDDAQARLTAAFEKGGLGAWADAAAQEVAAEAKVEVETREQLKKLGPVRPREASARCPQ
ncbi:hypothetical protein DFH09DRAFT_1456163 [Mycena vulgaris]|nr:hypothetical protein DFH09DRAFT_1456163 [Mycena vulgaris]